MKVILCEPVSELGEMGETVTVADGYARNYLLPRKLAVRAESASAKQIEHEKRIIRRREEKRRAELQGTARQLDTLTVEIKARTGEGDKIFGSVTSAQIAEELKELGIEVDRKAISVEEPIRALGIYVVLVQLGSGVEANLKVWVERLEEETV